MRRYVHATSHLVVRGLVRVAPKLVGFGAAVFTDELTRAEPERVEVAEFAIPITTGDVRFTLLTPDRFLSQCPMGVGTLCFAKSYKVYEPMMLACLTRLLQRTATPRFMDIGAFLGYYACYASALLCDQQEVHAIESNPLFADAIHKSARVNGFTQLRVFQAALSDQVERVNIDGVTVRHDATSRGTTITLDDLCDREHLRPTIIKMDVHGAEGKIVLGMRNTLAEVSTYCSRCIPFPICRSTRPGSPARRCSTHSKMPG